VRINLVTLALEISHMKVAIITAYHQITPEFVQCLRSVQAQSYSDLIHITVGDGCDLTTTLERDLVEGVLNVSLPKNIGDIGDTPRCAPRVGLGVYSSPGPVLILSTIYNEPGASRTRKKYPESSSVTHRATQGSRPSYDQACMLGYLRI